MLTTSQAISQEHIYQAAYQVNKRAATTVPEDGIRAFEAARDRETRPLARHVLSQIVENARIAVLESRPMCGDTGLPRYYVKVGNEAQVEGGFVALEGSLRKAVADVTQDIQLRSNRVHPLSRKNPGNNVGMYAPNVDYSFEPEGAWIEITSVQKGGLFGTDYRMLFPGDGIEGIKRFFLDTTAQFARRGLSCPPVIVGLGIGGTKDQCVRLSKEASSLRIIGDRHPDPEVAALEAELIELGNRTGFGVMGLGGDTTALDVHIEIAYTHTGGLPVSISHFCTALRRATARVFPDGRIEYRDNPEWFTPYYRRTGID